MPVSISEVTRRAAPGILELHPRCSVEQIINWPAASMAEDTHQDDLIARG